MNYCMGLGNAIMVNAFPYSNDSPARLPGGWLLHIGYMYIDILVATLVVAGDEGIDVCACAGYTYRGYYYYL